MMTLEELIHSMKIVAVVCNQWGDTGKGKFSHYFSRWADVIARGTGGANAGHTIILNEMEKIFHLLPAGIVYDNLGKINILGNGMVIDVKTLCSELDELDREGFTHNNLMISKHASVILQHHIQADQSNKSQEKGGIGTTGRGIGTCYADKINRKGDVKIGYLYDIDKLVKTIQKSLFYTPNTNIEEIVEGIKPFAERIKPFVRNTISEIHEFRRKGKKILLEGAQGLLLSIEFGTAPYQTSSDCSINGTAAGVGLGANAVDLTLGVVKFPFMTRVGGGPFPTEIGGMDAEQYCSDEAHNKEFELSANGIPYGVIEKNGKRKITYNPKHERIIQMMRSDDFLIKNKGIRLAAGEYGATTGRPRRIGWTDAVAATYAVAINGPYFILTKPDSIAETDFSICHGYIHKGKTTEEFDPDCDFLRKVTPIFKTYSSYYDITGMTDYNNLSPSLKGAIDDFEKFSGGRAVIISTGPKEEQTIVRG